MFQRRVGMRGRRGARHINGMCGTSLAPSASRRMAPIAITIETASQVLSLRRREIQLLRLKGGKMQRRTI